MLQTTWPCNPLRKFEIGRGGDKKEYLFAVVLGVVILSALALTIYFTFLGGGSATVGAGGRMFQCSKCGAEFSVDQSTAWKLEEMDKPMADCPKCGAKQSAYPMTKCPNPDCGKYFVRESLKNPKASRADDACPYCKTNLVQAQKGIYGPPPK